jgi:hypothetical protein
LHTSAVALAVEDEPLDELLPDTTDPWGQAGNKNSAKGPRVGRKDKQPTKKVRAAGAANASAIGQGQCPRIPTGATTARSSSTGPITSRTGT